MDAAAYADTVCGPWSQASAGSMDAMAYADTVCERWSPGSRGQCVQRLHFRARLEKFLGGMHGRIRLQPCTRPRMRRRRRCGSRQSRSTRRRRYTTNCRARTREARARTREARARTREAVRGCAEVERGRYGAMRGVRQGLYAGSGRCRVAGRSALASSGEGDGGGVVSEWRKLSGGDPRGHPPCSGEARDEYQKDAEAQGEAPHVIV